MGGLKVGVTLYVRKGSQSLWENGIFQNCFFLAHLLTLSPAIGSAFIVNGGDGDPSQSRDFLDLAPVPIIDMPTAMEQLDIVIELSAQLDPEWARQFRSRGGRVVGMRVANDYCIDVERMIFGKPHGMLISGTPYDVIWTLPAFKKTCENYYRVAQRASVRVMQHLWSPILFERAMRAAGRQEFSYIPGRRKWRLAIMEPNICMVKTSFIPMLIAELAHRADPRFIEYIRVYNTYGFVNDPGFVSFAKSLDMVRHGIATFEGRFPTHQVVGSEADAIICHHWENSQNYLYYELLYGGFPLIHNSDVIGKCGYRYKNFDCSEGALALRQAFGEHDQRLEDYRTTARDFLATLDPESSDNVQAYTQALVELV
jgi:hypothetical protein